MIGLYPPGNLYDWEGEVWGAHPGNRATCHPRLSRWAAFFSVSCQVFISENSPGTQYWKRRGQISAQHTEVSTHSKVKQLLFNVFHLHIRVCLFTYLCFSPHSPFSVEPSVGTLSIGESMQVTIDFLPRTTGDHSQQLLLHYHTGSVFISVLPCY